MGLQMVLGPSGSGKSEYVSDLIMKEASESLRERFFMIVPDQFTMQTQKDLVKKSPAGGIMNIDVLSFSRLAYRIFEETGGYRLPVIDDTGKNLVLRQCAVTVKEKIPYLGSKLDKAGYIHEIKSALSEFMQYDISPKDMSRLIDYASDNKKLTLTNKLKDLEIIYGEFKRYISEKYITGEESMDILAKEIFKSEILKDSTVILDGFTGFTPVQNKVILALLKVCKKVIITLTNGNTDAVTGEVNGSDLFMLTDKSLKSLYRLCRDNDISISETVFLEKNLRYESNPELAHLEKSLYRYPAEAFKGSVNNIRISMCDNPREEVKLLACEIRELLRNEGAYYRDIAVITGNLASYRTEIEKQFEEYDIPLYIDSTSGIGQNPFVEFIKSALNLYKENFSYDSLFRYLRTGFTSVEMEDIDLLENYVRETGIRGKNSYLRLFTRYTRDMWGDKENKEELLSAYEDIRLSLMKDLEPLTKAGIDNPKGLCAGEYIRALYDFLQKNEAFEKLEDYAAMFADMGDYSAEKEYSQIYRATMELFEQINSLVGDETMVLKDFIGILEAGFDEISIGTIPQNVDRIIVGDMERTRIKPVSYLFFLGLNDGWVPKSTGKGGIISDMEREFLTGSGEELAPSPRQQMYISRFYLYSNLTKPSKGLYLSFTAMDNEGGSVKPSPVIKEIESLFPEIVIRRNQRKGIDGIESYKDAGVYYAELVRKTLEDTISDDEKKDLDILFSILGDERSFMEAVINNAFYRYEGKNLDPVIAGLLYGDTLRASVSRMEKYAGCAYSYFMEYGMNIGEKAEYGITAADMGSIYHSVLQHFIDKLKEKGLDWFTFTEEDAKEMIGAIVEDESILYSDALFYESASNRYVMDRMKEVMYRSVITLAYQLRKGSYKPVHYELVFEKIDSLSCLNVGLNKEEKMRLKGKIDRVDLSEEDDRVYVKITDYKSGDKDFSLASFYQGVQLQMVVYMNEAVKRVKKDNPQKDVIPAALLYYHIDDPVIKANSDASDEDINASIRKELRNRGLVCSEEEVIAGLDNSDFTKSDVIPVDRKKDGSFSSEDALLSAGEMRLISKYADYKIRDIAKKIIEGNIDVSPLTVKKSESNVLSDACAYCAYKSVCGFNELKPGYEKRVYAKKDKADVLADIAAEMGEEGEING